MSKSLLDCYKNIRAPPHTKEMGTPRCYELKGGCTKDYQCGLNWQWLSQGGVLNPDMLPCRTNFCREHEIKWPTFMIHSKNGPLVVKLTD